VVREPVLDRFRDTFQTILTDYFESLLEPYEGYIALIFGFIILLILLPVLRFFWWVPSLMQTVFQMLFRALGVTHFVYKTTEVQRLVLK
jgi:hypothetical protein